MQRSSFLLGLAAIYRQTACERTVSRPALATDIIASAVPKQHRTCKSLYDYDLRCAMHASAVLRIPSLV